MVPFFCYPLRTLITLKTLKTLICKKSIFLQTLLIFLVSLRPQINANKL